MPSFAFYCQKAADMEGKNDLANLHEHFELTWVSGQILFTFVSWARSWID